MNRSHSSSMWQLVLLVCLLTLLASCMTNPLTSSAQSGPPLDPAFTSLGSILAWKCGGLFQVTA